MDLQEIFDSISSLLSKTLLFTSLFLSYAGLFPFSSILLITWSLGKAQEVPQILLGVKAFTLNEVVCKVDWICRTGGFLLDLSFKFLCH